MIRFRRAMHFRYAKGAFDSETGLEPAYINFADWRLNHSDHSEIYFVEPFGVEPKPLVFQTSEHGPPIRKLHIKYKNAPNHLCDRSAFFFIKLWKILFIYPFDITQFIYNSCKTEAAKTKMSCMLSHCNHILLITQFLWKFSTPWENRTPIFRFVAEYSFHWTNRALVERPGLEPGLPVYRTGSLTV